MILLKPEDWSPELVVAPHYKDIIPDITPLQQHFFTEICRLNLLGTYIPDLLDLILRRQLFADSQG